MKAIKIITLAVLMLLTITTKGQNKDGIYFIFTSTDQNIPGEVRKDTLSKKIAKDSYKERPIIFDFNLLNGQSTSFWHFESLKPGAGKTEVAEEDKHKTYIVKEDFLKEVKCYYWEDLKGMHYSDWLHLMRLRFEYRGKVYVVDRNDTKDGYIKIQQVRPMMSYSSF